MSSQIARTLLALAVLFQCAPGRSCAVESTLVGTNCHQTGSHAHDCDDSSPSQEHEYPCQCQIPEESAQAMKKQSNAEILPPAAAAEVRAFVLLIASPVRLPAPVEAPPARPPDRPIPLLN